MEIYNASTLKVQNIAFIAAMTVNSNGTMTPTQMVFASFNIFDHVTVLSRVNN